MQPVRKGRRKRRSEVEPNRKPKPSSQASPTPSAPLKTKVDSRSGAFLPVAIISRAHTLRTTSMMTFPPPNRWRRWATYRRPSSNKRRRQRPCRASRTSTIGTWTRYSPTSSQTHQSTRTTSSQVTQTPCHLSNHSKKSSSKKVPGRRLSPPVNFSISRKITTHRSALVALTKPKSRRPPVVFSPQTRTRMRQGVAMIWTIFGRYHQVVLHSLTNQPLLRRPSLLLPLLLKNHCLSPI